MHPTSTNNDYLDRHIFSGMQPRHCPRCHHPVRVDYRGDTNTAIFFTHDGGLEITHCACGERLCVDEMR